MFTVERWEEGKWKEGKIVSMGDAGQEGVGRSGRKGKRRYGTHLLRSHLHVEGNIVKQLLDILLDHCVVLWRIDQRRYEVKYTIYE